jgi:hypothetical protein
MEPGWRGDALVPGGYRETDRGGSLRTATGPEPAAAGARTRGGPTREGTPRGSLGPAGDGSGGGPAPHFAVPPLSTRLPGAGPEDAPFVAGEIADRGPLERGAGTAVDTPVREQRELERRRRGAIRRHGR